MLLPNASNSSISLNKEQMKNNGDKILGDKSSSSSSSSSVSIVKTKPTKTEIPNKEFKKRKN